MQKVILFFIWRGEELRGWSWQIWIVWWLNFCRSCFISPDFGHLQRVNWTQSWTKRVNFGYLPFREKFEFFKDSSNIIFVSFSTNSGKNFSQIRQFGWGRGVGGAGELEPQTLPPQMAHFMDAPSLRKHLKFYNFTTRNAMKIKLTTLCIFTRPFIWR